MCLIIHSETRPVSKVAKRNIYVYKFLQPSNYWYDECLYSPYVSFGWVVGKKYIAEGPVQLNERGIFITQYELEGGAFHSYANKKDMITVSPKINIYKAMIPKGTRYWTGVSSGYIGSVEVKQYASKALVIIGRVWKDEEVKGNKISVRKAKENFHRQPSRYSV